MCDRADELDEALNDVQIENARLRDEVAEYRRVLHVCKSRIDTTRKIPVAMRYWLVTQITDVLNQ